jgi:hypothetical protein
LLWYLTTMEKEQLQSSTNTNTKQQEEEEEDKNEALALRYHNDIFQKGKLEVADEILSPDFVYTIQLFLKNYVMALKEQRNMHLQ